MMSSIEIQIDSEIYLSTCTCTCTIWFQAWPRTECASSDHDFMYSYGPSSSVGHWNLEHVLLQEQAKV